MVLIAECENCGDRRPLFDAGAQDACPRCSGEGRKVIARSSFEEPPVPAEVDEKLDYGKLWRPARPWRPAGRGTNSSSRPLLGFDSLLLMTGVLFRVR